ncbi:MAG: sulfite exporter TauE/SafE family protein [Myxococcales bacterium]|nr:sulfite exporter TauE/SafE family protein [Myxococcales bacterium]
MTLGAPELPLQLAILTAAGVAAGFLNTLAGGGSMLTLPALMLLGLPADLANGTNRLSVVTQSSLGAYLFHREGRLATDAALSVAAPTIVGALGGALAASAAPPELLKPLLLGAMLTIATLMVARPGLVTPPEGAAPLRVRDRPFASTATLLLAGFYGGFVQAGVGLVLLLAIGGVLRHDLVRANALKLTCVFLFGLVALGVFVWAGQVVWLPAAVLAVATMIGARFGVRFAVKTRQDVLRWLVFAAVVAISIAALVRE